MKSNWAQLFSKADNNELSRDFIHLSQFMAYGNKSVKYHLAIILEKCIDNKEYKNSAIQNLVALAQTDKRLVADLKYFAKKEKPEYQNLTLVAKEIIKKLTQLQNKRACI